MMSTSEPTRKDLETEVLTVSRDREAFGEFVAGLDSVNVRADGARSSSEALERLEKKEYRVVVVDADASAREAIDLIAEICRSYRQLEVIVIATRPTTEFLVELIRAGVYDFQHKPIDPKRLTATIRFLCQRKVSHDVHSELSDLRKSSRALLDQNQIELSREVRRANEELQHLNKALRKHVSQLTILYQMGRDISENENWSDALDRFLMALVNYMQAGGTALLLYSEQETILAPRSSFHVDSGLLDRACARLLESWKQHPRGAEIHCLESYDEGTFDSCLERSTPWRVTIIPLKHRNRTLGFLVIEKDYQSNQTYKTDYPFFNTIQTIFAEEVANASYISEVRRLSRFNEKVLNNINSGVITTDTEGNVKFFNERASQMCPYLAGSGRFHFNRVFYSRAYGDNFFGKILNSEKDTLILEVGCVRDRDRTFPARLSLTKMHDDIADGTVVVAIFEDRTEQKRLEAEIRKNDRLRVLGKFSAGVAHEIRNPLTGIATSAEVLASKIRGEEEKLKYIRAILDEIYRLDGIIRNLLNFARPAKPHFASCAPAEIVERVVNLLSEQTIQKGVELRVADELKCGVCEADANQLTQVLLNLVLNSVQACGKGDKIEVALRNEVPEDEAGKGHLRIDVFDTGPGVPEEVRDNLFEPFVTTKSDGTGLGLAISRQIIEEHGGKLSCDVFSGGTRFSIRLPLEHRDYSLTANFTREKGS